jgi:putative salt-induced outer membrane protein
MESSRFNERRQDGVSWRRFKQLSPCAHRPLAAVRLPSCALRLFQPKMKRRLLMVEKLSCAVVVLVLLTVIAPAQALAQWTAKAEAGVIAARGNTDTDSANVKFDVAREFIKWKQSIGLTGVYASDGSGATGQRWEGRGQSEYTFNKQGFWFGSARYEEDRFSGFEYQSTLGSGVGWRFFDDPITKFTAQIGVGYKIFETREALADDGVTVIPAAREQDVIGQGTIDFDRQLTETTRLSNKLLVEAGADNTFMQNDTSLQVKIMSSLALALGYSVRYNTDPPPGFHTTDTLTTLNLVYELK